MISDEVIEKVTERLVLRIEEINSYILEKMGENVKKFKTLTPSEAKKLAQILKYGGDYDKIVKKLADITKLNVKEIYEIFDEVAKTDLQFAEQFYKYRNVKYIPYEENEVFKRQVRALAKITAEEYFKNTGISSLGFGIQNEKGEIVFKGLKETYQNLIDEAVLSVSQGKESFDSNMYKTLKQIGDSGLKVIYPTTYVDKNGIEKHYAKRLDSAVRMDMRAGIKKLHNELQKSFGEEFGADMIEISVHSHPALDHLMQGHQFMIKEFEKLQNGETAEDLNGNIYSLDHDNNGSFRPISTMNCYHYVFSGIAGVNKPVYSEKELQEIIDKNNEGFVFENKHYTMYDGEQLLRKIELELRKSKEMQILGRASSNKELIEKSQNRITQLTNKYRDILKVSDLKSKMERARVSGYHRVNIDKIK